MIPLMVPIAPLNIWTHDELNAWITDNMNRVLSERDPSAPPVTEEEIAGLMQMMLDDIAYGIVPAGNA